MKTLDKVNLLRAKLARELARREGVCAIEIDTPLSDIHPSPRGYLLCVLVNDPDIGIDELGIPAFYEGVPVDVAYRHPAVSGFTA